MKYVLLSFLCLSCGKDPQTPKVSEAHGQRLLERQKTIDEVCESQHFPETIEFEGQETPCRQP
jgi:hypothetical protein